MLHSAAQQAHNLIMNLGNQMHRVRFMIVTATRTSPQHSTLPSPFAAEQR